MDYAVLTNPGSRQQNEDCVKFKLIEDKAIFVLADGLGGHGEGALASSLVCEQALNIWESGIAQGKPLDKSLGEIFEKAQERLLETQEKKHLQGKAKTTMVVLMIDGASCVWGHIGDSRLYFLQNHRIVKRTLDHSVPQMLVNSGELKEKKIRGHEDRAVLLRAMGTPWELPKFEIGEIYNLEEGMLFLLCSDGFWELIVEKQMEKLSKKASDCENWISMMEEVVRKNGRGKSMDNYSAIAVRIGDRR